MNKTLKTIVVVINFGMLVLALIWYFQQREIEPLIVSLGQVLVILALLFENRFSGIFSKNISNSKINIKNRKGDNVHSENIRGSKIKIS